MTTDKKQRKETPITTGVLDYFPDALAEVAHVSFIGNRQHNPGQPMHWAKHKSTDHADCISRHLLERGTVDDDGLRHSAKVAWRALAMLQIEIEGKPTEPVSPYAFTVGGNLPPATVGNPVATNDHIDLHECKRDVTCYDEKDVIAIQLVELGCLPAVAKVIVDGITLSSGPVGRIPWVYIAGPMRGCKDFNFPEFDRVRDLMVSKGFHVISPADMGRDDAKTRNPLKEDSDLQVKYAIRDFWSLAYIRSRAKPVKDGHYRAADPVRNGIVLLEGWEDSYGASAEFFLGRWLGLSFYSPNGELSDRVIAHQTYIYRHD